LKMYILRRIYNCAVNNNICIYVMQFDQRLTWNLFIAVKCSIILILTITIETA